MDKQITTTIALDEDALVLLDEIAEREAGGEKPNRSREVRKLIREKASRLGLDQSNDKKNGRKP